MPLPESSDNAQKGGSTPPEAAVNPSEDPKKTPEKPNEIGGPKGLEPTRYGDWEQKGRCIDF